LELLKEHLKTFLIKRNYSKELNVANMKRKFKEMIIALVALVALSKSATNATNAVSASE
jgi:hypothetical protein